MAHEFEAGHALVVGVGGDLPGTVLDAEAVAQYLTDPNYCAFPASQVTLLTGSNANKGAVLSALEELASKLPEAIEATGIVYFSGHGIGDPSPHLLTHGYDLTRLPETAVPAEIFTQSLQNIQADRLLVLLDCCHAGAQARAKGLPQEPIPGHIDVELKRHRGRVVIASSLRTASYAHCSCVRHREPARR